MISPLSLSISPRSNESLSVDPPSLSRRLTAMRERDCESDLVTAETRGGGGCCPPMDLMRSEPMQLVQVIVPMESAHLTVFYLGNLGLVKFKDLSSEKSPSQRTYAAHVTSYKCNVLWKKVCVDIFCSHLLILCYMKIKRCGEMARKIRFFKDQMSKAGVSPKLIIDKEVDIDLDDVEVKLGELEVELVEINANNDKLQCSYNELVEYKLVLQKAGDFFASAHRSATAQQSEIESQQIGEDVLKTPLLQEELFIACIDSMGANYTVGNG